jgi:hypothetical protein
MAADCGLESALTAEVKFVNLNVLTKRWKRCMRKPQSAADYERLAQTMEYDSERAMFEAYGGTSTHRPASFSGC